MPLVLYPEELHEIAQLYDDVCDELVSQGAEFSRTVVAQRLLKAIDGYTFIPEGLTEKVLRGHNRRYLH